MPRSMSKRKPAFTVLYEGPAGYKSGRLCQTTRLVITTRTIEIERDGVDCVPAVLTCGLWSMCCTTSSIEIYELEMIVKLVFVEADNQGSVYGAGAKNRGCGIIEGEVYTGNRCGNKKFSVDTPDEGDGFSTRELYKRLREAWDRARHSSWAHEQRTDQLLGTADAGRGQAAMRGAAAAAAAATATAKTTATASSRVIGEAPVGLPAGQATSASTALALTVEEDEFEGEDDELLGGDRAAAGDGPRGDVQKHWSSQLYRNEATHDLASSPVV